VPIGLLKSNLTYTISVSDSITDPSGNKMPLAVTTNFTMVGYTEPRVVVTTPATSQVIGDGTTLYLRFNNAIDGNVFCNGRQRHPAPRAAQRQSQNAERSPDDGAESGPVLFHAGKA
jgi:hypothetical protein